MSATTTSLGNGQRAALLQPDATVPANNATGLPATRIAARALVDGSSLTPTVAPGTLLLGGRALLLGGRALILH